MCDYTKVVHMLNGTFSYCDHRMNLVCNAVLILITYVSIYAIIIAFMFNSNMLLLSTIKTDDLYNNFLLIALSINSINAFYA